MKSSNEILIIDDDKIFVYLLTKMFEKLSCTLPILNMKNGLEGLDFIKKKYEKNKSIPSVILLDLNMPMFDGWQFLEELECLPFASKLIIFVTSSTVDRAEIEKVKCHKLVKEFQSKPINSAVLRKIIDLATIK